MMSSIIMSHLFSNSNADGRDYSIFHKTWVAHKKSRQILNFELCMVVLVITLTAALMLVVGNKVEAVD